MTLSVLIWSRPLNKLSCLALKGFPDGSVAKNLPTNAEDRGSIPGWGRSPGGGNGKPTPGLLPGESHGQRSLLGYSPWGLKEPDTTEELN